MKDGMGKKRRPPSLAPLRSDDSFLLCFVVISQALQATNGNVNAAVERLLM